MLREISEETAYRVKDSPEGPIEGWGAVMLGANIFCYKS